MHPGPDLPLDVSADLPSQVHHALTTHGQTVACAESLTGGSLADRLSATPGASSTFRGGVVSYATDVKQSVLHVPRETLTEQGAVSAGCAAAMASGARKVMGSDWAVSTTGVAGPDRQEGKPVGLVFVAVAGPDGAVLVSELHLAGDRAGIRREACDAALAALLTGIVGPTG